MKGKILFLTGAAAGYVLGSKAGRQAYDQIKSQAQKLWSDPTVQKAASQAGQAAKDAARAAQSKISDAVGNSPRKPDEDAPAPRHDHSATPHPNEPGMSAVG